MGVEIIYPDTASFKAKAHSKLDDILADMKDGRELYDFLQSAK